MPNKKVSMFVILMSSIGHQNRSYDYENNNKTSKNQKFSRKVQESEKAI